jgi:hypothetical protein
MIPEAILQGLVECNKAIGPRYRQIPMRSNSVNTKGFDPEIGGMGTAGGDDLPAVGNRDQVFKLHINISLW